MEYNLNDIESFLHVQLPQVPEPINTFLDIAGFPNYENVLSNIYAYYLDRNNPHGFDDLFLAALCNALRSRVNESQHNLLDNWSEWTVMREESVEKKRIDLLLEENSEEEKTYIIIENKVYANLYNPLDIYWSYTESERKIGIVLSLFEEVPDHHGFINITHDEYLNEIKKIQGLYLEQSQERDLMIVKDLIINVKQQLTKPKMDKEILQFYHTHRNKIEAIYDFRKDVRTSFLDEVASLGSRLQADVKFKSSVWYRGIVDADNPDLNLVFYFDGSKEVSDAGYFVITLEAYKKLEQRRDEIMAMDSFFKICETKGVLKGTESRQGDFLEIAVKFYSFEDLEYNLPSLENIYNRDWKPIIDDFKKRI